MTEAYSSQAVFVQQRSRTMAQPNFKFQKRQKELEKKKKSEEKMQRKMERSSGQLPETDVAVSTDEGND
jgi:hypothetical protein